ncbi:hypothetical protein ABMY37_21765 [Vibrio vulnificus]|uniref:hypothetical protein n=1 Tax=Vibrio vulnificus TaxID=672 RepID=UPI00296D64D7|nr:hypothetical protein [Vibrio vulnificus]EIT7146449.1 hypothetical protein [Vibrio vulnificus]ELU2537123.1 hypothetical protein [Vibrio vulnificus]
MEVYALLVSIVSLLVSSLIAYVAYFKPASIDMIVGKVISFYPLPEQVGTEVHWGGVAFHVPITFHNWSTKGGAIEEVRIILEHKGNPSQNYDMTWCTFTQMHTEELRWVHKSVAQPIAVPGKGAVSEVVLFAWKKSAGQSLIIESGEYVLRVLAYQTGDRKPALKYENNFIVSNEIAKYHAGFLAKRQPYSIEVPLGESSRGNTVISREQARELYNI